MASKTHVLKAVSGCQCSVPRVLVLVLALALALVLALAYGAHAGPGRNDLHAIELRRALGEKVQGISRSF